MVAKKKVAKKEAQINSVMNNIIQFYENNKNAVFIVLGLILAILILVFIFAYMQKDSQEKVIDDDNQQIGGDTDEGGCLVSAGYKYDSNVKACIRDFELDDNTKRAAKVVVEAIGAKNGLTIVSVESLKCVGCYIVSVKDRDTYRDITITSWEIHDTSKGLTITECELLLGRPVIVSRGTCNEDEENLGEISTYKPDSICCLKKEIKTAAQDVMIVGYGETCNVKDWVCKDGYEKFSDGEKCGCKRN